MSNSEHHNEGSSLPADVARDFVDLQKQEIEVRKDEIALRSKEIDNSHEYSLKALDAQKQFYKDAPTERRKDRWQKFGIFALSFLLAAAFFIYLFSTGNGELATELIKIIAGAIFGGSAGYGIGFNKGKQEGEKSDE